MISITEATSKDFIIIQQIAHKAWPVAYGDILSKDQIDYMLETMYSLEILNDNFTNKNNRFLLISELKKTLGFASYEPNYLNSKSTRLHKLYLLPECKRMGFGALLFEKVVKIAQENNSDSISLNVNRCNKSYLFYQKMGFKIITEENISIGYGYFMEDYNMEKLL